MNRTGARLPRPREHRLLSAVAVVVMLVAGLLTLQTTVAKQPEASAASSVGGKITRAEVIARAKYWYDRGDTWYSQDQADAISDGDGHSYRPDCSGLVAMAWHLPKKSDGWDLNTDNFHSYSGKTWLSSLHNLLPGDALLRDGHMELFEKWVDPDDHTDGAWVYSENDYGQKTNHNINSWSEMNTFRGIRYNKIVDPNVNGDYNGDGATDIALYRPADGSWWARSGVNPNSQIIDGYPYGGKPGDIPAPGDYNGDGVTDVGLYRPSDGTWWVRSGKDLDVQLIRDYSYGGRAGDTPASADYNGDGVTDIGLYRPVDGTWWARSGNNLSNQLIDGYAYGGREGDVPQPGDYNGDGVSDLGLYRPADGTWWVRSGANLATQLIRDYSYGGRAGDIPAVADYNGDGATDIALYRSVDGTWWARSGKNVASQLIDGYAYGGREGDTPAPGDYNGDGVSDLGLYRPVDGTWWVRSGANPATQLIRDYSYGGRAGDTPVTSTYVPTS